MSVLGFNIGNGTLRWAVVEGVRTEPVLVVHDRLFYEPKASLEHRMGWFSDHFDQLIQDHAPAAVAYRMHMGRAMTQEQVAVFHYPWGLLLLACARAGLPATEFTGTSLTAKRFGLPKGAKPMEAIDAAMANRPASWDDPQRYAACVAWGALG